ncbi:DUF177 domain-containing protein [bacterium]|nr:DUF177 domain-containing protein [bacterium]
MIIDIDQLSQEGWKISKDFEFSSGELVEERTTFHRPVHAEMWVKKEGEDVLVKGRISSWLSLLCSRCLLPYNFSVDSEFDHVYMPEEFEEIKEELEEEDINKLFYYNRELNLRDVVLEQLNLTFPLKPLCSEDCQGICPVCGNLVSSGKCTCRVHDADPRLEKLNLFRKDKTNG